MIPPIASRFVAGTTASGALDHVSECNEAGMGGILNLLGEHYDDPEPAAEDADAYCHLVSELASRGLNGSVSVKPSQIGIDVGPDVFRDNFERIVETAAAEDVFVWCDMEDHTTTDTTLDAVEATARDHPHGVGVAIQANLTRTRDDLRRLADVPAAVRLVKGAYDEPSSVALDSKSAVDDAYEDHLEFLFREFDQGVAVGSHDPAMLQVAVDLHKEYGTPFEIQMLMGVREDAQRELAAKGYEVNQYVPYGDKWMQYFYRRIRERKENALFALRAVVGV
ncbi:proline dehydrogenase [Natrinema pellirubrum DSM 15624]|uniref:proline dehydrogenase n=1 Tax=Natrinema pellirubrum (strain DSM 15624 / CIP 106293 / JCM 10476 / NCIMB 786 / 157) TaxID=797303 RepID=L0JSL4_NATP1|nr:proline dehydrogenase family protein [Natrinema pellirubrum]AGB33351.1 proline dehydrogenase [Natrinema pellirubrum DSM 15624]ELY71475.1 proline dehydrogenase [Natrinema pellirubrum DSM 15624]